MHNLEPNSYLYDMVIRQTNFYHHKKYTSLCAYKYSYLYFIDDVNVSYRCNQERGCLGIGASPATTSANMELVRQLLETQMFYSTEEKAFITMNNVNLILAATNPGN
jgi:hypothetical protein